MITHSLKWWNRKSRYRITTQHLIMTDHNKNDKGSDDKDKMIIIKMVNDNVNNNSHNNKGDCKILLLIMMITTASAMLIMQCHWWKYSNIVTVRLVYMIKILVIKKMQHNMIKIEMRYCDDFDNDFDNKGEDDDDDILIVITMITMS